MFKVITKGCEPIRATEYSGCVDVFSAEDVVIGAGETAVIGLGIAIDFEKVSNMLFPYGENDSERENDLTKHIIELFLKSHYLQLMLRSSLGRKGLILPNGIGVIDLDYTQEIKMIIHNPLVQNNFDSDTKTIEYETNFIIKKGDKIGQITLMEHKGYLMGYESDVERTGGIGSTGR